MPSIRRLHAVARRHPAPGFAVVETAFWLLILLALIDHLRAPDTSTTAHLTWYLTIGIHELGHVVCMPFGWLLYVAGGSIWQILFWALLGLYAFLVRRQITSSLLMWAIAGHSFINLARYIGDARARKLPLLFGLGQDSHDWWNLLERYGLLDYDHVLAGLATLIGALLVLGAVTLGILAAWALPRTRIAPAARRFQGGFWAALRQSLTAGGDD
jgi:hypothetical protein